MPEKRARAEPQPQGAPSAGPTYHHANANGSLGSGPEPVREVLGHRPPQQGRVRGQAVDQLSGARLVKESDLLLQNRGKERSSQPIHDALTCKAKSSGVGLGSAANTQPRGPRLAPLLSRSPGGLSAPARVWWEPGRTERHVLATSTDLLSVPTARGCRGQDTAVNGM